MIRPRIGKAKRCCCCCCRQPGNKKMFCALSPLCASHTSERWRCGNKINKALLQETCEHRNKLVGDSSARKANFGKLVEKTHSMDKRKSCENSYEITYMSISPSLLS